MRRGGTSIRKTLFICPPVLFKINENNCNVYILRGTRGMNRRRNGRRRKNDDRNQLTARRRLFLKEQFDSEKKKAET